MSRGYIVVRKYGAAPCGICNFLRGGVYTTAARFPARLTALALARLRFFSLSDVYVTAARIKRSKASLRYRALLIHSRLLPLLPSVLPFLSF